MIQIETEIDGQRFRIAVRDSRQAVSFVKSFSKGKKSSGIGITKIVSPARKKKVAKKKAAAVFDLLKNNAVSSKMPNPDLKGKEVNV